MDFIAKTAAHRNNIVTLHPRYMSVFDKKQPRAVINRDYLYDIRFDESVD